MCDPAYYNTLKDLKLKVEVNASRHSDLNRIDRLWSTRDNGFTLLDGFFQPRQPCQRVRMA